MNEFEKAVKTIIGVILAVAYVNTIDWSMQTFMTEGRHKRLAEAWIFVNGALVGLMVLLALAKVWEI